MRAMLSRLRARDAALFVLIAGLVAAAVIAAGREAGWGGSAVGQAEPLILTLSAPEVCETRSAERAAASLLRTDAEGNRERYTHVYGWSGIASVPVRWRVSGGAGPYTLVIDGEPEDADGAYAFYVGEAMVGCADTSVGTSFREASDNRFERLYRADPQVDSGLKTIQAVVTDVNGRTAAASVDVYVILSTGSDRDLLARGQTYRVFDHLITVPAGIDMRIGDASTGSGGSSYQSLYIEGTSPAVVIWFELDTFRETKREIHSSDYGSGARGASRYSGDELRDFHSYLDALASSIGQLPNLSRSDG